MLPLLKTHVPGPRSRDLAKLLRQYECWNTTMVDQDWPIFWQKARGANVWDADDNRYIDLTAAFGVANIGHSNPVVVAAARKQLGELVHGLGDVHPNELKAQLAKELASITFERWSPQSKTGKQTRIPAKVFFANSGSEAVEIAIKTAMLVTGKPGVLAFVGGYHGLTYGALDATAWKYFRAPFHTQLPGFTIHVAPTEEAIRTAFREASTPPATSIGAVIVEPIQGRGGVTVPPEGFLPMLRRICDEKGALLIADEIYTGFCRTGRWFAVEHWNVVPDLICVGKAMSNGFPISACVGRAQAMDAWPECPGEALHTSTHLGSPLGCAMALATIAEMKRLKLDERVRELQGRLPGHGLGLMRGIPLLNSETCQRIVLQLLRKGIIALGGGEHGNVLTLTPPLTISDSEIAFAADEISKTVT